MSQLPGFSRVDALPGPLRRAVSRASGAAQAVSMAGSAPSVSGSSSPVPGSPASANSATGNRVPSRARADRRRPLGVQAREIGTPHVMARYVGIAGPSSLAGGPEEARRAD